MNDPCLVFNELSITAGQSASADHARAWMQTFIETVQAGYKVGLEVRSRRHLAEIELVVGYTLRHWLNDSEVGREAKQLFKTRLTRLPYLEDLPDVEQMLPGFECIYDSAEATDLGLAYLLDSLALSLPIPPEWDQAEIEVTIHELNELTSELHSSTQIVKHVSHPDHLAVHQTWIEDRRQNGVQNGEDLWRKCPGWFPHLIFCQDVVDQIHDMLGGSVHLRQVFKRLSELNNYCRSWHSGGFDKTKIHHADVESEATRKQHGRQREFRCPDGEVRYFAWHVRLTPGSWRLYFFPDTHQRKILIGYVGRHLDTASE